MVVTTSRSRIRTAFDDRVEQLRQKLGYPIKERDPQGSDFYYLRPGSDAEEAAETCPIAVGFYDELNEVIDERSLQRLLTSSEWQQRIYGHYLNRTGEQQPVMYILMPTEEGIGQVPLVLPTEGGLRQRNIQTFAWDSDKLETRLSRLRQGELPIAARALTSVPLVERAFYEPIKTAKELAGLLAEAARRIEQIIPTVYKDEERRYPASKGEKGYLHQLLRSFQQELLPSLRLESENEKDYSFSDIYAQTIAYSLFTARVFSYMRDQPAGAGKEELFDRQSAWQKLPETNPFLRKLFRDVSERSSEELGDDLIGAIADIFTVLRAAKMDVILQDFRQKMNREDIVIRFYEDFLAAYKPEMRERRGVYYTPEPVVSYMVRSVDVLLKEKFNKPLGLADPEVMILDPACGTGTFLLWICQLIHDRFHAERDAIIARVGDISWSEYVSEHLLPRIFGFELLMAPYAIAHLKLGLFLEEKGYQFDSGKRLGVFLTNTLDNPKKQSEFLFEGFIADEANQAVEIKRDKPIMIVIGNPPYSGNSTNRSDWIDALLKGENPESKHLLSYYKSDGKPLGERKVWLQDDYIKFIRWGQWKISLADIGILAFVTNHSYLDTPTFRGVRQSILDTFRNVQVIDLHGNSKKKEKNPDGFVDQNVFDIQQGVAINFFLKDHELEEATRMSRFDLWGTRESKYQWLNEHSLINTEWNELHPSSPFYMFTSSSDLALDGIRKEYEDYWRIKDVLITNVVGIQTSRDHLVFDFDKSELLRRIKDFSNPTFSDQDIRARYFKGKGSSKYPDGDTRGWKLSQARKKVQADPNWDQRVVPCLYRPFDIQSLYYTDWMIDWSRSDVMQHMLAGENLGLITNRSIETGKWEHIFCCNLIIQNHTLSIKEGNYLFPLYLYPETRNNQKSVLEEKCRSNLSPTFLNDITNRLGYTPTPEAIFYYIYAIFHSPTYRSRYAEFLKIDFPRVPLTRNDALFRQLATYGAQLVALHLMKSPKLDQPITNFVDQGGNAIVDAGHPKYSNGKVTINKKGDGFAGVPKAV